MSAFAAEQRDERQDGTAFGLLPPRALPDQREFLAAYGPRPKGGDALIAAVHEAGLTGRGGAAFPTAIKLEAVRHRRRGVVVANGTEGEPASWKDKVLLRRNPHLVIDGALLAAEAVRARRVIVAVSRDEHLAGPLGDALAGRSDSSRVELVTVPHRFVAGEESALINFLSAGEAKPTVTPPRPFERGVDGRPTLVQNVETLANLALIARYGAGWSRSEGSVDEPGRVLTTVSGAVRLPGVLETPLGTPLCELFARCGGLTEPIQAYLVGGYFGRWVPAVDGIALSNASLSSVGGGLGARTIVALGERACGVRETAAVAAYLARESAGQCGPCVFGLQALAERLATIARAQPGAAEAYSTLAALHRQIARRGACAHPDGALAFVLSATRVFSAEFKQHLQGRCCAPDACAVLPIPHVQGGWR